MILINSSPKDALKIFQPFLPIYVPIGVGCLLAAAEKAGIDIKLIDEQVEDNVLERIKAYVKRMQKPYIFGFSVLTAPFRSAVELSKNLKELYPDSVIIFGGVHPTAMPDEVLSFKQIDVVMRGEGDKFLIEFYKCVKEKKDYTHIDSLSFKRNNKITHNKRAPIIDDIDTLPSFPYHKFTSPKYDLGFVLSSRGCPYQCIFCSNRVTTGKKYRYRSAKSVVPELELIHKKYNKNFVIFLDDNLCVNKQRVYELIDTIKAKGLHKSMTFSFQSRGDNVDYKLLRNMYEAGFKSVFFGLETANEEIMKIIKKGETLKQCVDAVKMAKRLGFHVSATFMYALPEETHRDRIDAINLSKKLDINMVRFNNATPYPGTELYDIARSQNRLHVKGLYDNFCSVSTFIENSFDKIPFSYVPPGNTEEEIRKDILFSYFSFYIDYKRLKEIFTKPGQGAGWFNAGEKITDLILRIPSLIILGFMLLVKLYELFYYMVIKKSTKTSLGDFMQIFKGLTPGPKTL